VQKSPACRQEGESVEDCVARKIPEIKEENPDWDDDQVQAVAFSICEESCADKQMEKTMATREGNFITKHLGIPLEKGFTTQEDGSILVRGFFTSDNIDEIGDIITQEATEKAIPKYRQWGNIRYMHMPKPVAKVINIGKDDGLDWNEVEIQVIDPEAVFQVKNGLLKALSVGIIIRSFDDIEIDEETGAWKILAYELVEISLVDHPANYDARLFLDEDKNIPVSSELRQLVATHGFTVVSKALGAVGTLEEGFDMAQLEQDLQADEELEVESAEEATDEAEVEAEVELSADADETEETEEAEETEEEAIPDDVEQLSDLGLAGTVEVGEDGPWVSEEDSEETVEEELVLEESGVEFSETTEEEDELLEVLVESLEEDSPEEETDIEEEEAIEEADDEGDSQEISEEFAIKVAKALIDLLSEAEAEAPEDEEQSEAERMVEIEVESTEEEEVVDPIAALTEKLADLESQLAELRKPAKRTGRAKTEVLPHEALEEVENAAPEEEGDLLKSALRNYISRPVSAVIRDRS